MAITTNLKFGNATDDSAELATQKNNALPRQAVIDELTEDSEGAAYSTGNLPSQELERLVRLTKEISAVEEIQDDQFQPASLDLRVGPVAYRVRASFLPGKDATVEQRLDDLAMHKMDITSGGC